MKKINQGSLAVIQIKLSFWLSVRWPTANVLFLRVFILKNDPNQQLEVQLTDTSY